MSSLIAVKSFFHRVLLALVGPSRAVLGMIAFLAGLLSAGGGALYALFGGGNAVTQYLQSTRAPDLADLVSAVAVGAWVGVVVFGIGFALLWSSRWLDPNGPVRGSKAAARKVTAGRRSVAR